MLGAAKRRSDDLTSRIQSLPFLISKTRNGSGPPGFLVIDVYPCVVDVLQREGCALYSSWETR